MIDREKTAFATKCRAEGSISYGLYADSKEICDKCPYKIGDGCDLEQILHDAYALLKEQEVIIEQYHKADVFLETHGWKWEGR